MTRRGAAKLRRITESEVVALLKAGKYRVDRYTAEVTGPTGEVITPVDIKRDGRMYVRVYGFGGVRTIARARLVWLSVTLQPLPGRDWEVHHWDEDRGNDRFDNLIALHRLDHYKLHRDESPIPF
jgi:hypothetical protein